MDFGCTGRFKKSGFEGEDDENKKQEKAYILYPKTHAEAEFLLPCFFSGRTDLFLRRPGTQHRKSGEWRRGCGSLGADQSVVSCGDRDLRDKNISDEGSQHHSGADWDNTWRNLIVLLAGDFDDRCADDVLGRKRYAINEMP